MYQSKFEPTELELRLVAERQAAEDEARRAITAERAEMAEKARERMRAEDAARAAERAEKGDPIARAAKVIRAAIPADAWPAVVGLVRSTDPHKLKFALLSIASDEDALARHRELVDGMNARNEAKAREKAERQSSLEARAAELAA